MKRKFLVLLPFWTVFILSGCSKSDDDNSPAISEKEDICMMMDDLEFMRWCYENYDVNKDSKVSSSEAAAVREFIPGNKKKFKSIKGLEYFTGVENLDVRGTFKSINLQYMHNLKRLYVDSEVITYDFSNTPLLTNITIKNESPDYSLDKPSIIINGFEKLNNPNALLCGIVKMDQIDLSNGTISFKGYLIVKKLILSTKQLEVLVSLPLEKNVTISGETFNSYEGSFIYWQTVNSVTADNEYIGFTEAVKLIFVNKLTQNNISCTWEGIERTKTRLSGSWSNDGEKYAIMRFDRPTTSATQGIGYLLYFENSYKETLKDKSEFTWSIVGDDLKINYQHTNWAPVHAEYNTTELVIKGDNFVGTWYESSDKKFEFNYKKSTFNDWAKYK